jgi:hypothetical protein
MSRDRGSFGAQAAVRQQCGAELIISHPQRSLCRSLPTARWRTCCLCCNTALYWQHQGAVTHHVPGATQPVLVSPERATLGITLLAVVINCNKAMAAELETHQPRAKYTHMHAV